MTNAIIIMGSLAFFLLVWASIMRSGRRNHLAEREEEIRRGFEERRQEMERRFQERQALLRSIIERVENGIPPEELVEDLSRLLEAE